MSTHRYLCARSAILLTLVVFPMLVTRISQVSGDDEGSISRIQVFSCFVWLFDGNRCVLSVPVISTLVMVQFSCPLASVSSLSGYRANCMFDVSATGENNGGFSYGKLSRSGHQEFTHFTMLDILALYEISILALHDR